MSLSPVSDTSSYSARHLGPDAAERADMLERLGYSSLEELIEAVYPDGIEAESAPRLPEPLSEKEAQDKLRSYAQQNIPLKSFYGQGFYDTITPPAIRRNLVENPGFYTSYTPYQAEISQGRLEGLLNFQTAVSELTGLPLANASLLDEASATAEAVGLMARQKRKGTRVLLDSKLNPQVLAVAAERARILELEVEISDLESSIVGEDYVGVVIAYPDTEGKLRDPRKTIEEIHDRGGLATVLTDLLALQNIESPGELGAEIAIGNSQRFGVPLFFGGPHAAFMAVADNLKRKMPGRIVGVSKDAAGYPAYRLALQTREQHIRRERATSNICTAQALLAIIAGTYAVYHGADGLKRIADHVHGLAKDFAAAIDAADGVEVKHEHFFDTVAVTAKGRAEEIKASLLDEGYLVRAIGEDTVVVAFGESATDEDVEVLAKAFGAEATAGKGEGDSRIPEGVVRKTDTLTHPNFSMIHSETQLMRYLRKLADKDLALDRTMIPLGSCTLKLNPAAGLEPISWPEFANVHPYAPESHTKGWRALIEELEGWLTELTGYDATSVQPNAGSQGELAGLNAIRRYHVHNGDHERDICLVPSSAHGTNAASAALANLRVVVVKSAEDGSIDLDDLDAKLEKHSEHIAAIMITYPSTHGVFEHQVRDVCDKVHAVGGQVYIDGANMNALAGLAKLGELGGDVSHLNLHKTFAIPHGGGGPGVGPVALKKHLQPFLPADPNAESDPSTPVAEDKGIPVASARWGSAGVLPITWAYLAMSGTEGLAQNSASAILAANYVAHELNDYFPVLYTGKNDMVGHECILDVRPAEKETGVTATDIAKRLVDYGLHAPTLAFPVEGTLMVEPTESEDQGEIDRFIAAMKSIHGEIQEIADGKIAYEDSVIHNAPYTQEAATTDNWEYKFPRSQAVWPVTSLLPDKYFPPVRRIDEAYGDRNLQCSCPPPEAFDIEQPE